MAPPPTRIVLIRHGESQAQVQGFVSGHSTCTGLSDLGRTQAERLRDRLLASGELSGIAAVETSILPRAIETAQILLPALGVESTSADCDWCELHPGDAEGLRWPDFRKRFPPTGDPDDPFLVRFPGMETWAEMYVRVGKQLRRIADSHAGERVVIVAHGGTIGASFVALGRQPVRRGLEYVRTGINTSMTEWELADGRWSLLRFNDAAHVAGLTSPR